MEPTLKNHIKLWWHCLIFSHKTGKLTVSSSGERDRMDILCHTCKKFLGEWTKKYEFYNGGG